MRKIMISLVLLGIICVEDVRASVDTKVQTLVYAGLGLVLTAVVQPVCRIPQNLIFKLKPERIGRLDGSFRFKHLPTDCEYNSDGELYNGLKFGAYFSDSLKKVGKFYSDLEHDVYRFEEQNVYRFEEQIKIIEITGFSQFMHRTFLSDFARLTELYEKEKSRLELEREELQVEFSANQKRKHARCLCSFEKLKNRIDAINSSDAE